ncbi:MAG: zinc-ribbon domain-containing protein [Candidatus Accumulibacter sp.]|jgi:predicted Zn finger-like uncharacterized protein|nr:zinc-ribbon domain-containing protein [Accumulibacter sp.]
MKTRCPNCQTVFRITTEQLAARAGKVRCGHCRKVFIALGNLLEEPSHAIAPMSLPADVIDVRVALEPASADPRNEPEIPGRRPGFPHSPQVDEPEAGESERLYPYGAPSDPIEPEADPATEQILPRETSEIPGYSKWAEGVMAPPIEAPAEKPSYWPFRLAVVVLSLTLAGQAVFHFRGELAVAVPGLHPVLEAFSLAVDGPLPLPKHAELVGIETSDLQTDAARGGLLVLNATLRNKAPYGQAYPSLELSLTDTQDTVIARRVFPPQDYLSAGAAASPSFAANSDVAVRLWIEATNLSAAGYRLFVFYP